MRTAFERGSAERRGLTLIEVVVVLGIIMVLVALLLPAVRTSRGPARRVQCMNNLKQIALGLWNYKTDHGEMLPPAWTPDTDGKPLHDWRTLVLPSLDQQPLYHSINLAMPWDDPTNHTAREDHVSAFWCPASTEPKTLTTYLATLEPSGCLVPGKPRRMADVTDGASSTLTVIEAGDDRAVPWIAPEDADESVLSGLFTGESHHPPGGTNAAFLDGSVRFLKTTISPRVLRALVTIDGGEKVDSDSY